MIDVYVASASCLPAADRGGTSDPYVRVCSVSGTMRYYFGKTETIFKTLAPVWDAECSRAFTVPFFCCDELVFEVFDRNKVLKDKFLGTARMRIAAESSGQMLCIPIETEMPANGAPTLSVMFRLPSAPFPAADLKNANALYSYMTFNPPVGNTRGVTPLRPLYFKYVLEPGLFTYDQLNMNTKENRRFLDARPEVAYREVFDWVDVRRFLPGNMRNDDIVVVQLEGCGYVGTVTLNFVGVKEKNNLKKGNIIENVYGVVYSSSLQVNMAQGSNPVVMFPFMLFAKNLKPVFEAVTVPQGCSTTNEAIKAFGNAMFSDRRFWVRYYISRGNTISLQEAARANDVYLGYKIRIGLGWDTQTDLDASVYCYNFDGEKFTSVAVCYYAKTSILNGSIYHSGDNRTGFGKGDDEQIVIKLDKIPDKVNFMIIGLTSFSGVKLNKIVGGFMRIVDVDSKVEIMYLPLTNNTEEKTCLLFAVLKRVDGGEWDIFPTINFFKAQYPGDADKRFLSILNDPEQRELLLNYNFES